MSASSIGWLQEQEARLRSHPFLATSGESASSYMSQYSEIGSSKKVVSTSGRTTPLRASSSYNRQNDHSGRTPPSATQHYEKAEDISLLWQRAEAAHSKALQEIARMKEQLAASQAGKLRAETNLQEEIQRRRIAEAAARQRAKEAAEANWRLEESVRMRRDLESQLHQERRALAEREHELAESTRTCRRLERNEIDKNEALDKEKEVRALLQIEIKRAESAQTELNNVKTEMQALRTTLAKENEEQHKRAEAAKQAVNVRAARDRERARQAELDSAKKAQELLELWQKFQALQRNHLLSNEKEMNDSNQVYASTSVISSSSRRRELNTQEQHQLMPSTPPTTPGGQQQRDYDSHGLLRAKVEQARQSLESSQHKLRPTRERQLSRRFSEPSGLISSDQILTSPASEDSVSFHHQQQLPVID